MIALVKNIRQLVTPLGTEPRAGPEMDEIAIREGVRLVLRDDRILAVEPDGPDPRADRVIDAAGGVVVPGLVDPCVTAGHHPHAYGAGGPDAELVRLRAGIEALLRQGTTSAEIRAAADAADGLEETLADLQRLSHRVALRRSSAFLGAPCSGATSRAGDRISTLIGELIPSVSRRHLAATCVALCGEGAYNRKEARAVLRAARGAGLRLRIQASGSDADALLAATDVPVETIDHLEGMPLGARGLAALRKAGTMPILLPGARVMRREAPTSARPLLQAGLPIALGSAADIVAGGVFSLWTGVSLAVRDLDLRFNEALVAATLNAAVALGSAHEVGTLEPGKFADFAILDIDDVRRIPDFVVGLPIRAVFVGGREAVR